MDAPRFSFDPTVTDRPRPDPTDPAAQGAAPRSTGETAIAIAAILAPAGAGGTTLAFWFGWTLTNARSSYFGIDASVLGYTVTDYVLRSADAMLVPALLVLLLTLVGLAVHTSLLVLMAKGRALAILRSGSIGVLVAGAFATLAGCWALFAPLPFSAHFLLPPILLGSGGMAIAYSVWLLRALGGSPLSTALFPLRRMAMWDGIMFATVSVLAFVCLFWGASLYASALGIDRAQTLERQLGSRPVVTVYSRNDLALGEPVRAELVGTEESAYRFRYTGLRLITQSANRYFLVTEGWTRADGTAIVLPESDGIRYEFRPGGVPLR